MVTISIFDLISKNENDARVAIAFQDKKITYKELTSLCMRLSKIITSQFESIKEPIGIFICGSLDYAVAFFSIIYSNNVVVPLNINMKKSELMRMLEYLKIRIIITNKLFYDRLVSLTDAKINIICIKKDFDISFVASNYLVKQFAYKKELEDIALILHTSGSFSSPKSVMLTHDNLISCAASIVKDLKITDKDVTLVILPMHYSSAVVSQFLSHLLVGGTVVFTESIFTPKTLFSNIEKYRVTNFSCVPNMLVEVLYQIDKIKKSNVDSWRYVCFGGAPSSGIKINQLVNYFPDVEFIQTYGLTEAATRISHYFEKANVINNNCVGFQIPNVTFKVIDDCNNDCANGVVGEIVVKGPNVMKGYYMRHDENEKVLQNGWLHTGDLGTIDSNGSLYIIGRKKNVIIRNGENIYPEEIEEVLCEHPAIQEAYVYGLKNSDLDEIIVADVINYPGMTFDSVNIQQFCRQRLSNAKVPKEIHCVKQFERTSSGKMLINKNGG